MKQGLLPMESRDRTAVNVPVYQKNEGLTIVDRMAISSHFIQLTQTPPDCPLMSGYHIHWVEVDLVP